MNRRDFLKLASVSGTFSVSAAQGEVLDVGKIHRQGVREVDVLLKYELDTILIACGGAGIEMIKGIDRVAYGISRIVAIDTDKAVVRNTPHCDSVLWLRNKDGRAVKSIDECWEAADNQQALFSDLIGTPALAIIVTGLGGAAGFCAAYMAARCARQAGAMTLAFATLPLACERKTPEGLGLTSSYVISEVVDNLLIYDHRIADRCLPAITRFSSTYEFSVLGLRQYLWNTVGCLTRLGLVGMNFEDVRSIFCRDPNAEEREEFCSWPTSRLGWGTASGGDRAQLAASMAVQHPLLEAEKLRPYFGVSVSIRSARKLLNLNEVGVVMSLIKSHCDPDARIVFSADADDALEDRLQVSVILVPKEDVRLF